MAAVGSTPIKLYGTNTASQTPLAANLANDSGGIELAVNGLDGKLFYKDNSGNVQVLASKATGSIGGSTTQVQFNNSGVLGGSASLTWSGTVLTSSGFAGPLNGTVGATTPNTGAFTTVTATGGVDKLTTASGVVSVAASAAPTAGQVLTATSGTVATWQTPSSSGGDVVGPASATANGIALFDSTTGKLIKDSAASDGFIYGIRVGRGAGAVATNTAVGASALQANTTGAGVVAVGYETLYSNNGNFNTGIGRQALRTNSTGYENVGVGYTALYNNSSGIRNTAIGTEALNANTTASNNTAVGYQAGYSNTTGTDIAALGLQALKANTTGSQNTAFGSVALTANTTASHNSAFGYAALFNNTTGASNVALGNYTLQANTTASNNTAVGYQASYSNTTGELNTTLGWRAGYSNTTGVRCTAIGYQAGYSNTTSSYNLFVGVQAGYFTTGSANTFVGQRSDGQGAGNAVTTGSNNTILGGYNGNQGGLDIRTANNHIVLSDGDGNPLISTADNQTVALEGAVPNSGTGITFPATQSASSNANTLDDYEEGTWTPTLTDGYTRTYNQRIGRYIKVGKQVYVFGQLQGSTRTGSPNGSLYITLPFPANELGQVSLPSTIGQTSSITLTGTIVTLFAQWDAQTELRINGTTASNIAADFQLGFFFVYLTNS